jgi:hypothetical protein
MFKRECSGLPLFSPKRSCRDLGSCAMECTSTVVSESDSGGICWYYVDQVSRLKSSDIASDSLPGRKGLWCRHISSHLQTRS